MNPIVIDCDTGRDDALAIMLALSLKKRIVSIVSSYGNTSLANVIQNNKGILSLYPEIKIPIFIGAKEPIEKLSGYQNVTLPRQNTSGNGLCDITLSITPHEIINDINQQVKILTESSNKLGKIDYIIIGPVTSFINISKALGDQLNIVINSVTFLGSKLDYLWPIDPNPDFNVISDPFAVSELFKLNIEKRLIPIDCTWDITLNLDDLNQITPTTKHGVIAKRIMSEHLLKFAPEPIFRFHDPSVLITYNELELFRDSHVDIIKDEDSKDFGKIIESSSPPNIKICDHTKINRSKILKKILASLDLKE